jgi:hypothetical protein
MGHVDTTTMYAWAPLSSLLGSSHRITKKGDLPRLFAQDGKILLIHEHDSKDDVHLIT